MFAKNVCCACVFLSAVACSAVSEDGEWVVPSEADVEPTGAEGTETTLLPDEDPLLQQDQQESSGDSDEEAAGVQTIRQAITGTHKICSVVNPDHWRTATVVDNAWARNTCQALCVQFSGTRVQLGCLFNNNFSFGAMGNCTGGPPPAPLDNSCQW